MGGETTYDGELLDGGLNKGFKLGKGWVNVTAEYRDRGKTNRAGPDPRDQIVVGDAGKNVVAQPSHWVGDPETTDYLTFINFQVPAGDASFVYAFGGYSKRDGVAPGFYRRALQFTQNWPQIYPIGFLPLINTGIDDSSGTIGARGTRSDGNWDMSLQGGRNSMDFNITNTLNASLGPTSKTEFYAGTFDDRIVFSGNFTGGAITALLAPLGATGARFFTNAINTRTSGVDLAANYRTTMSNGSTFRLFAGYYGSFCVKQLLASGADDQIFPSAWVADLELAYRLEKVTFGVGVQNLTDAYPDQVLARLNTQGVRYPTTNTFGLNGRFLYAKASLRF